MAEEAADQHIRGISLGDPGEGAVLAHRGQAVLPTDIIGEAPDPVFHVPEVDRALGPGLPGPGDPRPAVETGRAGYGLGLGRLEWIWATARADHQGGQQSGQAQGKSSWFS